MSSTAPPVYYDRQRAAAVEYNRESNHNKEVNALRTSERARNQRIYEIALNCLDIPRLPDEVAYPKYSAYCHVCGTRNTLAYQDDFGIYLCEPHHQAVAAEMYRLMGIDANWFRDHATPAGRQKWREAAVLVREQRRQKQRAALKEVHPQ